MRTLALILLSVFFVGSGVMHFTNTAFYMPMMPRYLPYPRELVYISGAFEILGGLAVLVPGLRRWAGYGLAALLVAVFPANVHMAVWRISPPGFQMPPLLLWLRLPLQFVFVAWALWATAPTSGAAARNASA